MHDLVSNFADAEVIFGKEVRLLCDRLNGSDNLTEMISLIEFYLQKRISQKIKDNHPIDLVCQRLLINTEPQNLDLLAKNHAYVPASLFGNLKNELG